jgi:hypothetical protein
MVSKIGSALEDLFGEIGGSLAFGLGESQAGRRREIGEQHPGGGFVDSNTPIFGDGNGNGGEIEMPTIPPRLPPPPTPPNPPDPPDDSIGGESDDYKSDSDESFCSEDWESDWLENYDGVDLQGEDLFSPGLNFGAPVSGLRQRKKNQNPFGTKCKKRKRGTPNTAGPSGLGSVIAGTVAAGVVAVGIVSGVKATNNTPQYVKKLTPATDKTVSECPAGFVKSNKSNKKQKVDSCCDSCRSEDGDGHHA